MENRNRKIGLIGAFLGFTAFLFVGLLPSLVYGGYSGLLLAGGIFGTPVPQILAAKGLIVFGMVLGVIGCASLFTVAGAGAAYFMWWRYTTTDNSLTARSR